MKNRTARSGSNANPKADDSHGPAAKPVSLHPLDFEEALADLLKVKPKPKPKPETPKTKKPAKKR